VSLKVVDDKKGEELKALMPQIRHEILNLAGSQKASEITSPDGKESLAEDIQDVMNELLGVEPPKRNKRRNRAPEEPSVELPVQAVFFTQFIVQ
jgi:flagellar protein FliL